MASWESGWPTPRSIASTDLGATLVGISFGEHVGLGDDGDDDDDDDDEEEEEEEEEEEYEDEDDEAEDEGEEK